VPLPRRHFIALLPCGLAAAPGAPPLLNGKDLAGWVPQDGKPSAWFTTTAVRAEGKALIATPTGGPIIVNGNGRTANLVTALKHGDCELHVEFIFGSP